jgi:type I restriction enzyme S subunit
LFARRGAQATGHIGYVREEERGFVCGTGAILLRFTLGNRVIDADYASHILAAPASIEWFKFHAIGATMPNLNEGIIRSFRLLLPPITEQRSIARLLSALDDKIELNRQMNATLEAMARAIFQDWFVDFGPNRAKQEGRTPYLTAELWALFPNSLDEEGAPMGWNKQPLDTIAEFLNGIALQKHPAVGNESLPVIKIAQLRSGNCEGADRASSDIPKKYIIENGDILFSWSGSLLHRVWTSGRGALNQHLFKVSSNEFDKWFVFYWISHHMPSFQATAASKATTMGHIQRHHLHEAMTIVPDAVVLGVANKTIGPLFDRMVANDLENKTLAATRDLLLPKLMSGELRVRDAETLVAEMV